MFRRFAAALAIVIAGLSAHAADVLTISGSPARVLPDTNGGEVSFPITSAATAPPAVKVVEVLLDGAPASVDGWTASLSADRFLIITVAPDRAREAGTYGIVVRAQPAKGDAQFLNVSVVRPTGELRFTATPLRLSRTVYFWGVVDDRPAAVTLLASPRRSTVTPAQSLWSGDLRSSDSASVGQVRIGTQLRIAAGTTVAAPLSIVGDPPLGTSTATVRIAAPQLAGGVLDQTVDVESRLSRLWLLIAVALGIVIGHLVRNVLENHRLRSEALLAANSVRDYLQELARRTPDAEELQKLQQILETIERVMRDPGSTPEQIRTATESANAAAKDVVVQVNTIRTESTDRIAKLRGVLGRPEGHAAPIAAVVTDLLASLRVQEQLIAKGESRSVARAIDTIHDSLEQKMDEARAQWTGELRAALASFAAASQSPIVAALVANVRALLERMNDGDAGPSLSAAKHLAAVLRVDVFKTALHEITGEANRALDQASSASDKSAIAAARERVNAIAAWRGDPAGGPLQQLMVDIEAMQSEIARLAPATPKEVALKFDPAKAAARVAATAAPPAIAEPSLTRIIVSGPAVAGERLSCRLVSIDGQLDPVADVTWRVNGGVIASGSALGVSVELQKPELVEISADTKFVNGSTDSTSIVLRVSALLQIQSTELLLEINHRVQWIQTALAGLLIALAGFVIFRANFVGTPDDLLVAFLWGFGSDIGLARVRELSQPLLERKAPGGSM